MSRPKVSDLDRIKRFVAEAGEEELNAIRDWVELLLMSKYGLPKPRRARKPKDAAQLPLAKGAE